MARAPIPDVDVDHVAAVEQQAVAWPRYGGDLPSKWVGGGGTPGFWSAFKVKDIVGAIARAEEGGSRPVGINLANAFWKEAFLRPESSRRPKSTTSGGSTSDGPVPAASACCRVRRWRDGSTVRRGGCTN